MSSQPKPLEDFRKDLQPLLISPSLSIIHRQKMESLVQTILTDYDTAMLSQTYDASIITALTTSLHILMAENIDLSQKISNTADENKELSRDTQRVIEAAENLAERLTSSENKNAELSRENQRLCIGGKQHRERANRVEREKSANIRELMACLDDASKRMEKLEKYMERQEA